MTMRLEGIHHITAVTGDPQRNLDFYTRVLGLRLVKRTVNQDEPTYYHLFYGDELGQPGMDLTFFVYPGLPAGRAGDGMVHRIVWRVSSPQALDFWAARIADENLAAERASAERISFTDPEGLAHELELDHSEDPPLLARHPEIAPEFALRGFAGVRAYSRQPARSAALLQGALGFAPLDSGWEVRGARRGGLYLYDAPPTARGLMGSGTVHHVAFGSSVPEHPAWRPRLIEGGAHPTGIIDRFYFRSIYFREPSGVLMEIATDGPGFAVDEPREHLGERLSLPPTLEPAREPIESALPRLPEPQPWRRSTGEH